VLRAGPGPGYDAVRDAVGQSSFGRCQRLLRPAGIYMPIGPGPWCYPLDQIVDAYRYVETGQKIGHAVAIAGPSR